MANRSYWLFQPHDNRPTSGFANFMRDIHVPGDDLASIDDALQARFFQKNADGTPKERWDLDEVQLSCPVDQIRVHLATCGFMLATRPERSDDGYYKYAAWPGALALRAAGRLKDLIIKGKFREDLFFKLNVIPMTIPPLRERTEDIPLLIAYFLRYFASVYGKKPKTMSAEALKAFLNYSWPGNVSELMNVMERFVILVEDEEIGVAHLNLLVETREHEAGAGLQIQAPLAPALEHFERTHIRRALLRNKWDAARAAAELDMDKDALLLRIKALHVTLNE